MSFLRATAGALLTTTLLATAATAETPSATPAQRVERLTDMLRDFPHVTVEERGGFVVINGYVRDETELGRVERLSAHDPEVIKLVSAGVPAHDRMIEVDAIIVVVSETHTRSVGFDFLQLVNLRYEAFRTDHRRTGTNFVRPNTIGTISNNTQWGSLLSASVSYDVNIANATDESASIVARPHLTTLNGEKAEFLSGGEIVFRVSGLNSGDIVPFDFGIQLLITPTIIPAGETGQERILLDVEASRLSVLGLLLATPTMDDVSFDKTLVKSKATLDLDETLVLSGLYQREYRNRRSGVPILRDIPVVQWFFSNTTEIDDVQSTVIFLTPRDPNLVNAETQANIEAFIDRRIRYVNAIADGTEEAREAFKEEYPNWFKPQPNSFATHIFMRENSQIYQAIRGEDLDAAEIETGILAVESAARAREQRRTQRPSRMPRM